MTGAESESEVKMRIRIRRKRLGSDRIRIRMRDTGERPICREILSTSVLFLRDVIQQTFLHRSNFDSTPPPILIDAGVAVLENEKIERHIMKNVPGGHNLFVQVTVYPRSYSRFQSYFVS